MSKTFNHDPYYHQSALANMTRTEYEHMMYIYQQRLMNQLDHSYIAQRKIEEKITVEQAKIRTIAKILAGDK